jgi:(1->4)-alpha-D-glucan 1-alpha-D-glucosylmutase
VRARISVLSTMAGQWARVVEWWAERCAEQTTDAGGPDRNEQLFVLQTLVGAWPLSRERLDAYLVKAFREAKRHTSWIEPDERWEQAVLDVVAGAMRDPEFAEHFIPFLIDVVHRADRVALGALVLRCTVPGVPDVYQGDELWNHLLVDPDNRRPVDWPLRQLLLDHQQRGASPDRFTAKLSATRALLALRARCAAFEGLAYEPLDAPDGVCAFTRGRSTDPDVVVVVPVRPSIELERPAGIDDEAFDDVLAPLGAVYGAERPGVFVRSTAR